MNTPSFADSWLYPALSVAVSVPLVAASGLALARVMRERSAPLRYGILLAALVVATSAPLIAALAHSCRWGAVRMPAGFVAAPIMLAMPEPRAAAAARAPAPRPRPDSAAAVAAVPTPPQAGPAVAATASWTPTWADLGGWLLGAWATGVVVCLALFGRDVWRLRRLLATLVPCTSPVAHELLAAAAQTVGLTRRPRLCESAAVRVPIVARPLDPVVILPVGMSAALGREKLSAVLVHEAAHVAHGDLWVGFLQYLAAAAFWWCAPIHRLNRRLADLREEICDAHVVGALGDGIPFAEVLIDLVGRLRSGPAPVVVGTLGAVDECSGLEHRVERLLDERVRPLTTMNRLAIVSTAAFALVATAVVVATTIHAADEVDEVAVEAPAARGAAQAVVKRAPPAAEAAAATATDTAMAIDAALAWLIDRQQSDGSWQDEGVENRHAATALVLLALLDRGHSHKQGSFRQQCERGLASLAASAMENQGVAADGGDAVRSQSLVSMALAKAYGMTEDPRLKMPAQLVLNAIADIPDRSTSAVGWNLMALHGGHGAYLQVDAAAVKMVAEFLDTVAADEGATFGEQAPGDDPRASAAGLWASSVIRKDSPALSRGVERLVKIGPTDDFEFDYFTTRVAHHVGGQVWQDWREAMARRLLETQERDGPDAGSWPRGTDAQAGIEGPVSRTALATLILETTLLEATR